MHDRSARLDRRDRETLRPRNVFARAGDRDVGRDGRRRIDDGARISCNARPYFDQAFEPLSSCAATLRPDPDAVRIDAPGLSAVPEECVQIHLAASKFDNGGGILGEREHHPVAGRELHQHLRRRRCRAHPWSGRHRERRRGEAPQARRAMRPPARANPRLIDRNEGVVGGMIAACGGTGLERCRSAHASCPIGDIIVGTATKTGGIRLG